MKVQRTASTADRKRTHQKPSDEAEQFRNYLFWTGRRLLNATDLSRLFHQFSSEVFGFVIGILDWRHISILLQHSLIATARKSKVINHLYDMQAGHTPLTQEKSYRIHPEAIEELSYSQIIEFTLCSIAQQQVSSVSLLTAEVMALTASK